MIRTRLRMYSKRLDNTFGSMGIEPFQRLVHGTILIVIPLDAGHSHSTHDLEAFPGVCSVAHDIPNAAVVGAFLFQGVCQYNL